jgi:hypothetical protein
MTKFIPDSTTSQLKAARTRLLRKEAKLASETFLDGGARTYLDTLPGIGVVLEFPKGRKCYFHDTQMAITFWYKKYARDFGTKVDPADHLSPLVAAKSGKGKRTVTYGDWNTPGWIFGPLQVPEHSLIA